MKKNKIYGFLIISLIIIGMGCIEKELSEQESIQPQIPPSKNVKSSPPFSVEMSFSALPLLDQPVNLTVDVIPTSDSSNFSIGILLPDGIELVKGDLIRKVDGPVTRGEKVQFNTTIKVVKEGQWEIKAIVGRDLNETWYEHAGYLYINASGNETTVSHFPPQQPQESNLTDRIGTQIIPPSNLEGDG